MKASILIARFPFGNQECPDSVDWLIRTIRKLDKDKRITDVKNCRVDDTPITVSRNAVMRKAAADGIDLLLMLDSDMKPDLYLGADPNAKPFIDVALDHVFQHDGPCVIGAPYCGPPPHENIYVFRPGNKQSDHPNFDFSVDQYGREEAAMMSGVQECIALPTGVILIDMRCIPQLSEPFFDYEYDDEFHGEKCPHCLQHKTRGPMAKKATTEDVYFSRNLALAGVKQYCAWDSWAGHWKRKLVGKPRILCSDGVREAYQRAIVRGVTSHEKLCDAKPAKKRPA